MTRQRSTSIGIGIDFGTSNSVAALYDGHQTMIVDIGNSSRSMPSATYLDKSFLAKTGQEAIDAYIQSNIGRRVELVAILLGEGRTSTGAYDAQGLPKDASTQQFFSESTFDANLPGRLFYGIKKLLAGTGNSTLPVFHKQYRLEALITPILLRIRQALTRSLVSIGRDPEVERAVIGCPVNFERIGEGSNELALLRLGTAFGNAGFTEQHFCQEPVAAALNYLHSAAGQETGTVLIVDFGGGTLDFCVFKNGPKGLTVLGTHGIALGGNVVDQLLFRQLLFPLLGEGSAYRYFNNEAYIESLFSFTSYAGLLLNWPVSYLLNQNRYLTPILDMIQQGGEGVKCFQRLYNLIQFNSSYLVLEQIKVFKEAFATAQQVSLDLPELDINLTITRDEFDRVIQPVVVQFRQALGVTLQQTGLTSGDIDRVVCVGGSTRLPAIKTVLEELFNGRVVDHDIFTGVAAGLAIQDYLRQT